MHIYGAYYKNSADQPALLISKIWLTTYSQGLSGNSLILRTVSNPLPIWRHSPDKSLKCSYVSVREMRTERLNSRAKTQQYQILRNALTSATEPIARSMH